jgi:hypothetical protein
MTDELEALEPSGSCITCQGERIEVKPLTIGQLPRLVRRSRPAINALLALEQVPDASDFAFIDLLLQLTEAHGEAVYEGVGICIGKSPEWMADLAPDEFLALGRAVYEVNRDFFVQRLGPLLAVRAGRETAGSGRTPSSS